MNMKHIVATSLVSLGAVAAHASDYNGDLGDMTGRTFQFQSREQGSFVDTLSFSLSEPSLATSNTWYTSGGVLHATFGLYGYGRDGLIGTADDVQLGLWPLTPLPQVSVVTLDAGRYYYAWSGRAIPDPGGFDRVSFRMDLSMQAVPEPASFAMLTTGLGLLGWRASRRGRSR